MQVDQQLSNIASRLRTIESQLQDFPVMLSYGLSPHGVLTGREATLCWDTTNQDLYMNYSVVEGTDWVMLDTGGAPGPGPVDALYLVLALNGILTQERLFTLAGGATAVDSGAGAAYTVTVHDEVTLAAAEIQAVFDLAGQALNLDTQVAASVFAGPAVGVAAMPTFRALVASDIPALAYVSSVTGGVDIDVTGAATTPTVNRAGNVLLLFDSGGAVLREYAFTDAGLIAGLAAMAAGDVLKMYAGTISGGPWTLAAGKLVGLSREGCILDGQITGSDATAIENLSIIRSEDDAGAISGLVEGAGEITMTLVNVTIDVSNATGEAHATHMSFGGEIKVYDTELLAETGSAGYAAYVLEGDFYQFGGRAKGTTAFLPYYV